MRKRIFLLVTFVALVLVFAACAGRADYDYDDTYASPAHQRDGLYMQIDAGSITPTGVTLTTTNNSQAFFSHGAEFTIETYIDGKWQQAPFTQETFWILPLFFVMPDSINEEEIRWEHMHGALEVGKYRLVRSFSVDNLFDSFIDPVVESESFQLYAVFVIEENWQEAHILWRAEQEALVAVAYARFDGLDLEVLTHSSTGLTFELTNNNPSYSYIIHSIFMGWEDNFEDGGHSSALKYSIFRDWDDGTRQPFEAPLTLLAGESISLDVDWYYEIGYLRPNLPQRVIFDSPNPSIFDLVVDVSLDVSDEYRRENFRQNTPGTPGLFHRISTHFQVVDEYFQGLELEVIAFDDGQLRFALSNENPYYDYMISSILVYRQGIYGEFVFTHDSFYGIVYQLTFPFQGERMQTLNAGGRSYFDIDLEGFITNQNVQPFDVLMLDVYIRLALDPSITHRLMVPLTLYP
ncbi:MAG: hypothetical protein FWC69_05005 [Defluviitaleaceae bacterium]|nr:hypothetical protein [Defluviitaleaceae bacterium]